MKQQTCCVCGKPIDDPAPHLGGRNYCQEHFDKVSHNRGSAWRSSVAFIVALLLFTVLVSVGAELTSPVLEGAALVAVGLVLSLVPAVLWLAFFYLQDVLEPEPKPYVIGVFLLGALLAAAVGVPVLHDLLRVQDWLGRDLLSTVLISILIVGFIQESLKFAAVRFSVYPSPEFDERMDGILYGTAAGLGYATVLNVGYVISSGGIDLTIGCIRIVVTALAQASFGGVTGYFLARAKFEERPIWWLPLGLTCAAILNGAFTVVRGGVARLGSISSQSSIGFWLSLVLAACVAVLTLAALLILVHRVNRLDDKVSLEGSGT